MLVWWWFTVRSDIMKRTTQPKYVTPFHSHTDSGMLPTEQTKLSSEMIGATIGSQKVLKPGWRARNRDCQKLFGTQADSAPAPRKPSTRSCHRLGTAMKKHRLIAMTGRCEKQRRRNGPSATAA